MLRALCAVAAASFSTAISLSQTLVISVPADQPTLQDAVNSAIQPGFDRARILLAGGAYIGEVQLPPAPYPVEIKPSDTAAAVVLLPEDDGQSSIFGPTLLLNFSPAQLPGGPRYIFERITFGGPGQSFDTSSDIISDSVGGGAPPGDQMAFLG